MAKAQDKAAHLSHLSQDDLALPSNGLVGEVRVLQDVGEDVHGLWHIGLHDLGVVAGLLAGGVGIQMRSHVLNLRLQLAC